MKCRNSVRLLSTALAVFLAGLFCADPARGEVYIDVKYAGDVQTNITFKHYTDEALFAKRFANMPSSGIEGHLFLPTPVNACSYIDPLPGKFPVNDTWIALVYDYPSCPSDMVMNVRNAGYKLIIASSQNDFNLTISKEVSDTFFPIVIIREEYADYLKKNAISNSTTDPILVTVNAVDIGSFLIFVAIMLVSVVPVGLVYSCCAFCFVKSVWHKLKYHATAGGSRPTAYMYGIQRHLQDIEHWRRNFRTKQTPETPATNHGIAMDDIIIDQVWVLNVYLSV